MNNKIIKIFLGLLFVNATLFANSINDLDSVKVAKSIGFNMSNESYPKNIELGKVKDKLHRYIKDKGFYVSSVSVNWSEKRGKDFRVKGVIVHKDEINRHIQTKFDALCEINKSKIVVNNVNLKNNGKPRPAFFIVSTSSLDLKQLSDFSFTQALRTVQGVAKRLDNNTLMDMQVKDYTLLAFMMDKLEEDDMVIPFLSDKAYSETGQEGSVIKTSDNWSIATVQTQFAYNNFEPKYFNILWRKDNILRAVDSYSTHSLVKSIQVALQAKGYDIDLADGKLNLKTKKALSRYIEDKKFDPSTQITTSLLWFINNGKDMNISKIVQAALLNHGKKIGAVDGKIGSRTISALKEYQRLIGVKADGKITPELVYFLLQTTKNVNVYQEIRTLFPKPILMKTYQDKMWPNEA